MKKLFMVFIFLLIITGCDTQQQKSWQRALDQVNENLQREQDRKAYRDAMFYQNRQNNRPHHIRPDGMGGYWIE